MLINKRAFGRTKGKEATLYTLNNRQGIKAFVSDYGATLVSLLVPDKKDNPVDVVLGYDDVEDYEKGDCYFGATIGRSGNRIQNGRFVLHGRTYQMERNEGGNNLHSGPDSYSKRFWKVEHVDLDSILFSLESPHMDQGFPGNLRITVEYRLTKDNEIQITYTGLSDEDTVFNPTNHSYFNMAGHDRGDVLNQQVQILGNSFTRTDNESIPTGEIVPVENTPFDFREGKSIGRDMDLEQEDLKKGKGYDHNWTLDGEGYRKVATMSCKENGVSMEVYTDCPCMQFYTGNFIGRELGTDGAIYLDRQGACFETQYAPNSINIPSFAQPIIKAGEEKVTKTTYRFLKTM